MSATDLAYALPRSSAASTSTARFMVANDRGDACRARLRACASAASSTAPGSAVCCAQPRWAAVDAVEDVGRPQQLHGVGQADLAREQPRGPVFGGEPKSRECRSDPCVGRDPPDVGVGGEHEPGARAGALDRGDDRRADREWEAVVVAELRRRPIGIRRQRCLLALVGASGRADAFELLGVGADTEVVTGAGQHDDSYCRIFMRVMERPSVLDRQGGAPRVASVRAGQRYRRNAGVDVVVQLDELVGGQRTSNSVRAT